jgi:hypothetical protein
MVVEVVACLVPRLALVRTSSPGATLRTARRVQESKVYVVTSARRDPDASVRPTI